MTTRHPLVRHAGVVLFFLLFSAVWSWPLVLSPGRTTVALHFDVFPAAWLVDAAWTYLPDGVTERSAWPLGEPLARLDSFLFLAIAVLLGGAVPGLLLVNLFVLLGPVASAWAAWRFAREDVGATDLAAVAAGLAFGFGPLAAVAALEGHVYFLFDPWLPLVASAAWRGRWPALALAFALALLSTAYLGIDALFLALALVIGRLDRIGVPRASACVAAMVGVGAAYAALYALGPTAAARPEGDALARVGSASLTTLFAWSPWMDLNRHSLAPAAGVAAAVLGVIGWWSTRADRGRTALFVASTFALLGALGPTLEIGVTRDVLGPGPLRALAPLGIFDVWRFPVRLAWVSALGFGALAATLPRTNAGALGVIALIVGDALLVAGAADRLRAHPTPTPAVYDLLPAGAVLELYPEVGGMQEDITFYQQNISCFHQLRHGRPLLERCLNTDMRASPRLAAARAVHAALLDERDPASVVRSLDVRSVVVHADLYQPHERGRVTQGLIAAFGAPIAEGRDGGEWLMAWAVR